MSVTGNSKIQRLEHLLTTKPVLVMGVLNLTPDSFSDGGEYSGPVDARSRLGELIEQGSDIVDIGAESTAPGATPVLLEQEWQRLAPTIRSFMGSTSQSSDPNRPVPIISIDTFKSEIARRCLDLGAAIINDVSALRADPAIAGLAATYGTYLLLMHSKEPGSAPHVSESKKDYDDVVSEISEFLLTQAQVAIHAGVKENRILLDPGMGRFISHDPKYSWQLLQNFERLCRMLAPFPVCIATSRKGFLGGSLKERDPISQLTALHAVSHGARIVRTHNPGMMRQFLGVAEHLRSAKAL